MSDSPETQPAPQKSEKAPKVNPKKDNTPDLKQAPIPLTPEEKRERSLAFDRFLTWGLIFVGIFSVFTGLGDYINPRNTMNALYEEMNKLVPTLELGTFQNIAFATLMGWVAVTIQAVILALVVWWSRQRMKAKKMSWWVPITGAVVSNMLSTACIFIALLSDPSFQEALMNLAASK
ncbi:hypothetical protein M2119_000828 [Aurantimicrobium minutum]|uniref:DUF6264 family protein n=1 Tax=Aurantimicrobium minutum TaxID=708131 RepID=UPI002474F565|nr:DUF6264 family protein [Aurantimicrobium minutum]MDH6532591.1 hypothetical protein [Aurantimicrobium minutum]